MWLLHLSDGSVGGNGSGSGNGGLGEQVSLGLYLHSGTQCLLASPTVCREKSGVGGSGGVDGAAAPDVLARKGTSACGAAAAVAEGGGGVRHGLVPWLEGACASVLQIMHTSALTPVVLLHLWLRGQVESRVAWCPGGKVCISELHISRVGQNHIYIWCFWQGVHQVDDHIWCIYTVLANPTHALQVCHQRKQFRLVRMLLFGGLVYVSMHMYVCTIVLCLSVEVCW